MVTLAHGESGYFSKPTVMLDPCLFDGEHLKPDVRTRINSLLLDYLNSRYSAADSWTMVWLAGSGISYQWSAARGNGDLDVLFGIDYDKFVNSNPDYAYMTRGEIAEGIDADLKQNLWPYTALERFYTSDGSSGIYEVTFFLNDNVEAGPNDIVNIHPYAAYNITKDEWTVKPPRKPQSQYPVEFEQAADSNRDAANTLVGRYNAVSDEQGVNGATHKRLIVEQAKNLFDTIHLGRKNAFASHGEGYGDYYNYAWQRAKQDGIVNALNEIINGE